MRTLLTPLLLFCLAYALLVSYDFTVIASGIAIFIVGMLAMEKGFKLFTGGVLSRILKKTTDSLPKAICSGFLVTAIVQSSSLTSVIAISFVTAELIELSQAIGIIFGANIGTTATAWIVAGFGLKINISAFALPMLIFGVIFSLATRRLYKGLGNVLLGLGFIFLGISFMKDGFENLKNGVDLARFAMPGLAGIILYVLVGMAVTVIIQSSSATLALIITAVATGQITYFNAISLTIGANIGTTVTAILGAITSSTNGKRLAVAHLIFNLITAIVAILLISPLQDLVEVLSEMAGIGADNITMKLSLFHTIFNVIGVLLVSPFINPLVGFLETLFLFKGEKRGHPKYLDNEVIRTPGPAITALHKEAEHLYDIVSHTIILALRLQKEDIFSAEDLRRIADKLREEIVDVNQVYELRIKKLYSSILQYAVASEAYLDKAQRGKVYRLKLACRDIIEAVKDIRELQKNISRYMTGENMAIRNEYAFLRENLAETLRSIERVRTNPSDEDSLEHIAQVKERNKHLDSVAVQRLSILLRDHKITNNMASSLMNDGAFTRIVSKKLLKSASILWAGGMDKPPPSEMAEGEVTIIPLPGTP